MANGDPLTSIAESVSLIAAYVQDLDRLQQPMPMRQPLLSGQWPRRDGSGFVISPPASQFASAANADSQRSTGPE